MLTDEDFEAVKAEGEKTIELADFVPYEEIDPVYFDRRTSSARRKGRRRRTRFSRGDGGAGLAAIGKYVMRDRQYLGCLRVRDGVITLEKMFFHDEIGPPETFAGEAQGRRSGARLATR